jgi:hypothetical protein
MDIANGIYYQKVGRFWFDEESWRGYSWDLLRVFNGVYEISNSQITKQSRIIDKELAEKIFAENKLEPIEYGFWTIIFLDKDDTQTNECCTACAMQYPFAQIVFDQYLTSEYADFVCQKCEESTRSPKAEIYCVDCGSYYYSVEHANDTANCELNEHLLEYEQQIQSQSKP